MPSLHFLRHFRARVLIVAIGLAFLAVGQLRAVVMIYAQEGSLNFRGLYAPGSSVTLNVSLPAIGTPSGAFQWLHDGIPIAGATTTALTLTHLVGADSGNYQCRVTNGSGVEVSNTVTLNVVAFPPSPVDSTFFAVEPYNYVAAELFQGAADGSVILAGNDSVGNPLTIRDRADGTLDPSVNLPLGPGNILAVLPGGDLIVKSSPYRLMPNGNPGPFTVPAGFDSTKALGVATVQPDGKFLVAQDNHLARLNPDGTVDASFAAAVHTGTISAVRLDSANRIVLSFTSRDQNGFFHGAIYRLTPDGQDDSAFAPVTEAGTKASAYPLADDSLLVLNYYNNGSEGPYLYKLKADGTRDPNWSHPGEFRLVFGLQSLAIDAARSQLFFADGSSDVIRRASITAAGLDVDPTFYPGEYFNPSIQLTAGGKLFIGIVRIRTDDQVSLPPVVNIRDSSTFSRGATQTLVSTVTGTGPFSYQWRALDGQPLPADSASPQLAIANFDAVNFGRYQLRVTGPGGSVLSPVIDLSLSPTQQPYLANLSGRAFVGTGDNVAIAGFGIKSDSSIAFKTLMRGAGPALQSYGVNGFLPNPVLDLYNDKGQLLQNNDIWDNDPNVAGAAASAGAFPFAHLSTDAALLRDGYKGNFTLKLSDFQNASGVGLLEIYRLGADDNPTSEFVNLSLRANVGAGDKVPIAGFVIVDPQNFGRTLRLVLRAVGPTLVASGVPTALADPVLTLYDANGHVVATNDNWSDNSNAAALTAAMKTVGAFDLPAGSKDAAMLIELPPGVYSIQATGVSGTTGVALLEIYVAR